MSDPASRDAAPDGDGLPLAGVKVLEVAAWVFVGSAGRVLRDWGADVVKVEDPKRGDPLRGLVHGDLVNADGMNYVFEQYNRGKRSVGLDLGNPAGREVFERLVEWCDVFLTNLRGPARRSLRVEVDDVRAINPNAIYVRGSGFGPVGPEQDAAAYDGTAYWARGGVAQAITPYDDPYPLEQPGAMGDVPGGLNLAAGVGAALYRRAVTGQPSVVDVSLLGTATWAMSLGVAGTAAFDIPRMPQPPRERPSNPLVSAYRTSDARFIRLSLIGKEGWWPELCGVLGIPDAATDPRFASLGARAEHLEECVALLDDAFAQRTFAEWCARLGEWDGPWAPYQSCAELRDDPQVVANGYVRDADNGRVQVSTPVQFDGALPAVARTPEVGEHTDEVLLELGYDWDRILELKIADAVT